MIDQADTPIDISCQVFEAVIEYLYNVNCLRCVFIEIFVTHFLWNLFEFKIQGMNIGLRLVR